jgi:CheY-like chemotaxis protein
MSRRSISCRSKGVLGVKDDGVSDFGNVARGLARSPLGTISLFIVSVYGIASLVTIFGDSLTHAERMPLIYFLVVFPILVLCAFVWLVSNHNRKLFGPSEFRNEKNYLKMQLSTVASLAVADSKNSERHSEADLRNLVEVVRSAPALSATSPMKSPNRILWVDDNPDYNVHERRAFEIIGIEFTLVLSTYAALQELERQSFSLIISDMARREGPREGVTLLEALRAQGNAIPFFLYRGAGTQDEEDEMRTRGAQGYANSAQELYRIVTAALGDSDAKSS